MLTTLGSALVVLIAMLGAAAYLKYEIKRSISGLKEEVRRMGTDIKGEIQQLGASVRRLDDRACFLTTVIQHHLSVPSDDIPGVPETKPSAPPPSASRGSAPDRNPSQT